MKAYAKLELGRVESCIKEALKHLESAKASGCQELFATSEGKNIVEMVGRNLEACKFWLGVLIDRSEGRDDAEGR